MSVADLYLSLISNSKHFIIDDTYSSDFNKMFENLKQSNANMAVLTPSFADLLLLDRSFNQNLMPNLQTILFCGEKLLKSTVLILFERFQNLKIINCYGPTECTFAVTSIEITRKILENDVIPVGIAKDNVKIYIVDENINQLPDGDIGEILITGDSVGAGYLNYTNNSFIKYNNKKAYLTGDLGYIKNNVLYFVSRKDKQVKFKGYRIELLDIENNLYKLPYIEKVKVLAKSDKNENVKGIIAFFKLKEKSNKSELQIKNDIKNILPLYMCPRIKIINNFPINKNGKCDEKKLMECL